MESYTSRPERPAPPPVGVALHHPGETPLRSNLERQALLAGTLVAGSVACLLLIAYIGFDTLSAARAYVAGEGLWSKAQKDAVYHLTRYAYTREPQEYDQFGEYLSVPLGDKAARLQLQSKTPDWDVVRSGFLSGGNHPDDITRMGRFFRRFRGVSYVGDAIGFWSVGDSLIARLQEVGYAMRREIEATHPSEDRLRASLEEVGALHRELARLENSFSGSLGAGSRWAASVLLLLITAVAACLVLVAVLSLKRGTTQLHQAIASQRASEAQLHRLVQNAEFGIVRCTLEGSVLSANPALVRMLGYASETELTGVHLIRDVYVDSGERTDPLLQLGADGSSGTEVSWRRRDGAVLQVRLHGRVVRGADGVATSVEAFVEDVTRQRALEAQLRQAQKMEAVGQFTGGIAHDFNNLLTVILSTAKLIEQELPEGAETARTDLADLSGAARRGADMIRQLLAFSRERQLQFHPLRLAPLVEAGAAVLRRILPANVEVRVEADASTPLVDTDPAAVEQILLNLATNARDAMPNGGVLQIATRLEPNTQEGLPRVLLTVSDTGTGMDPATRERLFEPFFTTKPPGQGTGLGLTMVYGVVKQHGGTIEVDSTLGRGTQVRMFFPAVAQAPQSKTADGAELRLGSGTVLLVEDEASIRRSTQRLLEHHGYRVLAACDGVEALTMQEENPEGIDLILSDIVMPRMGGLELYGELRRRGVLIPLVLMSGYAARDGSGIASLPTGVPFLAKPWETEDLLLVLQHAAGRD